MITSSGTGMSKLQAIAAGLGMTFCLCSSVSRAQEFEPCKIDAIRKYIVIPIPPGEHKLRGADPKRGLMQQFLRKVSVTIFA
jgi:hypothetical protein